MTAQVIKAGKVSDLKGLIQEAKLSGAISDHQVFQLNNEIGMLLHRHFTDFTGAQSGSLSKERIEQLYASWMFIMDLYIADSEVLDLDISIGTESLDALFKDAYAYIQILLSEMRVAFSQFCKRRIRLPNTIYEDTFEKALPKFFKAYNFCYDAANTVTDLDYPLGIPVSEDLEGIRYIRAYIEHLEIENDVLGYFEGSDLQRLLNRFSQVYGMDYRDLPMNIFEIAVVNHFFNMSALPGALQLVIDQSIRRHYVKHLESLDEKELHVHMQGALKAYLAQVPFFTDGQKAYIEICLANRIPSLEAAILEDNIDCVWL